MLEVDKIKEEIQLEKDRKEIVEWYIKNGLVENTASDKNYIVVSKEDYDDWD